MYELVSRFCEESSRKEKEPARETGLHQASRAFQSQEFGSQDFSSALRARTASVAEDRVVVRAIHVEHGQGRHGLAAPAESPGRVELIQRMPLIGGSSDIVGVSHVAIEFGLAGLEVACSSQAEAPRSWSSECSTLGGKPEQEDRQAQTAEAHEEHPAPCGFQLAGGAQHVGGHQALHHVVQREGAGGI